MREKRPLGCVGRTRKHMPEFKDELRTILTASFWENVITLFDANRLLAFDIYYRAFDS